MGANSKIAWCHHTFNVAIGCAKVSPGCDNCYAERGAKRMGVVWGPDGDRRVLSESYWKAPLAWNRKAREAGARHRVFCSSMADVFEDHPALARPRGRLSELIAMTPRLDWLLLTKRPENMTRLAARDMGWSGPWPSNVWAGTTVENQAAADQRIPELCAVDARIRFLSCEPLLERVDLGLDLGLSFGGIHWVIVGGESGPRARSFDLQWARDVRAQCAEACVSFFMKQTGERAVDVDPLMGASEGLFTVLKKARKGDDPREWPEDLRVREVPHA